MNAIGQKIAQLVQSSRALSGAQLSAGGINGSRGMSIVANQLSKHLIHVGRPQAINGVIKPTISKINLLDTAKFSSKADGVKTPNLNFMNSEEMAPLKQMQNALKEFSRKYDPDGLTKKEIERFNTTCYNLLLAKEGDEVGMIKSSIHSSVVEYLQLIEPTILIGEKATPEAIQALDELHVLKNETVRFLLNYKRDY